MVGKKKRSDLGYNMNENKRKVLKKSTKERKRREEERRKKKKKAMSESHSSCSNKPKTSHTTDLFFAKLASSIATQNLLGFSGDRREDNRNRKGGLSQGCSCFVAKEGLVGQTNLQYMGELFF